MSSTAVEPQPELAIGLHGLIKKYKANGGHARHVTALAEQLFRELAPLHGLPEERLDWLRAAGLLHDLGHFIDEGSHHKHSHYIILNDTALDSWPSEARAAIAFIALNHRKARERGLDDLPKGQARELRALACLLRMADVLDYDGRQEVTFGAVRLDETPRQLTLELKGKYDMVAHAGRLQRKMGWASALWKLPIAVVNGETTVLIHA